MSQPIRVRKLFLSFRSTRKKSTHFGTFVSLFNILKYFFWLRITDEGSVPKMRMCSILLIKSVLKYILVEDSVYISTTS